MESRVIVFPEKEKAVLLTEEVSDQGLAPDEAVVQTIATAVSPGTELSRFFAIKEGFSYPVHPGYSAVGRVLAAGTGLRDVSEGDIVFHSGPHASVCRVRQGERTQGEMIFRLPKGIDPHQASLMNLCFVAMSAVNATEIKLGDTVAVFGLGPIGVLAASLYNLCGARVIGVDPVSQRCQTARDMGVKATLDCAPAEQVKRLFEMTGGRGADITVDATGLSSAIVNAVLSCARYGQVILLGSPRQACAGELTPVFHAIHMNMLRVVGAFNNLAPVYEQEGSRICVERNFHTICSLVLEGRLRLDRLISHVVKPEEVQAIYEGLMHDRGQYRCVVIDWT